MAKNEQRQQRFAAQIQELVDNGPYKLATANGRRLRIQFNNRFIVDTTSACHVWEHFRYPWLYVPWDDVKNDVKDDMVVVKQMSDTATGTEKKAVILKYPNNPTADGKWTNKIVHFEHGLGQLTGLVRFEFGDMDQWYEEDSPIYIHPKDPTKRIEILPSSRPIEIRLGSHVLAKSNTSLHLIESVLPIRYYLPPTSIDPSILVKSDLQTGCPYKGQAEYYHVIVGNAKIENLIWYYKHPTHECAAIAGALCFYNEKVEIWLDGKRVISTSPIGLSLVS